MGAGRLRRGTRKSAPIVMVNIGERQIRSAMYAAVQARQNVRVAKERGKPDVKNVVRQVKLNVTCAMVKA